MKYLGKYSFQKTALNSVALCCDYEKYQEVENAVTEVITNLPKSLSSKLSIPYL